MLKLKQIRIRNWLTVADQTLDFPSHGLVVVNGVNHASNGKMASVGSGKTALGEALSRTVLGIPGRFSQLGHYSRHDKGNLYVNVTATYNDAALNIETGYRCPELSRTGAALRYAYDGRDGVERDRVENTRQELDNLIGLSTELSQWTVHLDGGLLQFSDLSQRNAVDLLMTAMNQPPWDDLYVKARATAVAARSALQQLQSDVVRRTADLKAEEESCRRAESDLANESARVCKAEATQLRNQSVIAERISASRLKLQKLNDDYQRLQDAVTNTLAENKELEQRYNSATAELDQKLAAVNRALNNAIEQRGSCRAAIAGVERRLHDLTTPVKTPVKTVLSTVVDDVKSADDLLATVQSDVEQIVAARQLLRNIVSEFWHKPDPVIDRTVDIQACQHELDELALTLKNIQATAQELSQEQAHIDSQKRQSKPQYAAVDSVALRETTSAVNQQQRDLQQLLIDLESSKRPVESHQAQLQAVIDERRHRCKKLSQQLSEFGTGLNQAETLVSMSQYWEEAYSPSGIPNMILNSSISALNDVSHRISTLMTGGTITVSYSTTREMRGGASKPALDITVQNQYGASRVQGSSKGEAGLTNLIIAETLAEVGCVNQHVCYRWYDEITNGQDPQVRASIFAYLKDLAERKHLLIFLVDHSPEATNYADHILLAIKDPGDGGTTTFKWETNH